MMIRCSRAIAIMSGMWLVRKLQVYLLLRGHTRQMRTFRVACPNVGNDWRSGGIIDR